jgi:hypothetical protein
MSPEPSNESLVVASVLGYAAGGFMNFRRK